MSNQQSCFKNSRSVPQINVACEDERETRCQEHIPRLRVKGTDIHVRLSPPTGSATWGIQLETRFLRRSFTKKKWFLTCLLIFEIY